MIKEGIQRKTEQTKEKRRKERQQKINLWREKKMDNK